MSLGDILALKNKAQLNDMTNRIKNRITKDLSTLLQQHGKNIVITGDSLSFNRYDFDATFRTNAYDCMPGMQSWSFMLRDAIHRNDPYFTSAEDTIWGLTSATATFGNFSSYYGLFNNRGIDLNVKNNTDEFRIYVKQKSDNNNVVLYMQKLPNNNTCKFDIYVDGKARYRVYYVDSGTEVTVPSAPGSSAGEVPEWSVSGDGSKGFIVTVELS
jgi:hypothetical protein